MPTTDTESDQARAPEVPQGVPFAAWPDPRGGYVVLDLRTITPVAGPFFCVERVVAEMDRMNAEHAAGTPNPKYANSTVRLNYGLHRRLPWRW